MIDVQCVAKIFKDHLSRFLAHRLANVTDEVLLELLPLLDTCGHPRLCAAVHIQSISRSLVLHTEPEPSAFLLCTCSLIISSHGDITGMHSLGIHNKCGSNGLLHRRQSLWEGPHPDFTRHGLLWNYIVADGVGSLHDGRSQWSLPCDSTHACPRVGQGEWAHVPLAHEHRITAIQGVKNDQLILVWIHRRFPPLWLIIARSIFNRLLLCSGCWFCRDFRVQALVDKLHRHRSGVCTARRCHDGRGHATVLTLANFLYSKRTFGSAAETCPKQHPCNGIVLVAECLRKGATGASSEAGLIVVVICGLILQDLLALHSVLSLLLFKEYVHRLLLPALACKRQCCPSIIILQVWICLGGEKHTHSANCSIRSSQHQGTHVAAG
mmetsp:Transcript_42904/g.100713  ORF Transcript_42904/g.100713 Transcript_42904/m.100713 type:complete len:381 (+) Transcript_42904:1385-2527(+)